MANRSGTIRLARFGSIDVFIHWSWLIIATLLVLGFQGWLTTTDDDIAPGPAWLLAVSGALVFFASILTHELAHAFMAKARGIEVAGITLFVFGGATEADASSRSARDELIIAIVGPVTSLVIAGVLGTVWLALDGDQAAVRLIGYLAVVNLVLALFNLVPGLPLDGGRVLRAVVWGVTGDFARATHLAANMGTAFGYLLIGVGLVQLWLGMVGGLWLVAIGWMISSSARQTEASERIRDSFAGLTAADIMTSPVVAIPADLSVARAANEYLARHQLTVFPVEAEGRAGPLGTVGLGSVGGLDPDAAAVMTVAQLARPIDPALLVPPDRPAADVIRLLADGPTGTRVLGVENGRTVGVISPRDIGRRRALTALLRPRPTP